MNLQSQTNSQQTTVMKSIRDILPKIDKFQHKGRNGRIGVIGGCYEYTGAPYYSAISLLKGGGDLSHIFCTQSAAIPIKSYSPEIIVHPFLFSQEQLYQGNHGITSQQQQQQYINSQIKLTITNMQSWYQALHAFVIGPGIGRDEYINRYIPELIDTMDNNQIIVLDADGLWFLSHGNPEKMTQIVQKKSDQIILTPNQQEFERLWETNFPNEKPNLNRDTKIELLEKRQYDTQSPIQEIAIDDDLVKDTVKLSKYFNGVQIIHKGNVDIITNSEKAYIVCQQNSLKRCGGIGDILTGLTSLYAYWGQKSEQGKEGILKGCVMGSYITRLSTWKAYEQHKFGLTAPNIIDYVGPTFNDYYFAKL